MAVRLLQGLPLSPKQIQSVADADRAVNIWTGAIRSGKTVASLLRWLIFVANAPLGGQLVMVGRTRESLARNVFAVLQDPSIFGEFAKQVRYTPGAAFGYILDRKVWVFGASDSRAEAILRGLTVAGAYGDELTLWSEALWVTLLGRMSVEGAQLFGTTNPDNPGHWLKSSDRGVDKAAALDWRHFHFHLDDNQWLLDTNPTFVARLKREYTGLWYRRFILGEWVQAEGAVYEDWSVDRHVIAAADVPKLEHVVSVGMDYGSTNPTRAIEIGWGQGRDGQRRLYAVDEWAPVTGLTDAALSHGFRTWLADHTEPTWRDPEWIYLDPSAKSLKLQLYEDGVMNVAPAHNAVVPGIRVVQSLLQTGQLLVSDRCAKLIEFLPGYSWDADATKRGEDKPLKVNDHEVDALRYAVYSSRSLWRSVIPTATADVGAPGTDELPEAA